MKSSLPLLGIIFLLLIVAPVCADPTNWTYSTPGMYNWTCPVGVTSVAIFEMGAGGSGAPGVSSSMYGLGGYASSMTYASGITVVPGTNYTITVGESSIALGGSTGNKGGSSIAFGVVAEGGNGGIQQSSVGAHFGGPGQNSTFNVDTVRASEGGFRMSTGYWNYTGGAGGFGTGSGGGGGGGATGGDTGDMHGGKGADGIVKIYITGSPGFPTNQPNFVASSTTGHPGTVITFTDTSIITDLSNLTYAWDFGDFTNSSTVGTVSHVYSYMGTFTVKLRVNSSVSDSVQTIKQEYITITSASTYIPYVPNQVRFTVVDKLGRNVPNAYVSAVYDQTTLPAAQQWLSTMYGVDPAVAAQMLSSDTVMAGTTGVDGAITFTMHASLRYNVTAVNGSTSISSLVYPKDNEYTIWLPGETTENLFEVINATLTFNEPNSSYYTMGAQFQDHADRTSALLFYVNRSDGTPVYSTSVDPGTSLNLKNYTVENIRGEEYYWGIRGTRTGGNISLDQGVTSKGPSGMLVDLRLPDPMYYPWISLFLLFLVTSLASKNNLRFMAVLVPVMAALFFFFGWLYGTYVSAIIPFCGLLGATYYMKGSLRENYGTGGPGSMLMNIVVFMIILQMSVGFINETGWLGHAAVITPKNEFSNVDLTTVRDGVSNFGGINDPLQSANSFASLGWVALKVGFTMITAALCVSIFLIEMFPYVPAGFFMIIQGGIYIIYVIFILKLVAKSGPESDF